jgi:hypothetical protein
MNERDGQIRTLARERKIEKVLVDSYPASLYCKGRDKAIIQVCGFGKTVGVDTEEEVQSPTKCGW